jgi:hypothetical protein
MEGFLAALREQRWDDHRYYHHSLINQSLHFVSAISFLVAYVLLFVQPAVAALLGWLVGMVTRQSGHFFFEPKGYDAVNQVTHEYKEQVKVGYNLRRKVVLHLLWGLAPLALWLRPDLFGVLTPAADLWGFVQNLALAWLGLGVGALIFRTVHLFFIRDVQTGLVWFTKIVTDPFNDLMQYRRAPLELWRQLRAEKVPAAGSAD